MTRVFAVCPKCKTAVQLRHRKDFESFSKAEVLAHYEAEHPEALRAGSGLMPYAHEYAEADLPADVDPPDCEHSRTEADDDGLDAHWNRCADCGVELMAERDEDGGIVLVPVE